ncbi:MAG: 3-hydroxyisobutyrate dehydrogenase [Alphaproteobacteria bacterium]
MARIGFIGVGNMGGPMAANLVKAGHQVTVWDPAAGAREAALAAGSALGADVAATVSGRDAVVTMLPSGAEVRAVYQGSGGQGSAGAIAVADPGTLLIDCSTIDVLTAREVAALATAAGHAMLDAPVSGGVLGAAAATLTFMVGGDAAALRRAEPVLAAMGTTVVHAGPSGSGQAAKLCNNLILGVSMIAVSEAFALADRLGLDRQVLFDVASRSSGQCWALTTNCPVPGPVPASPANHDYRPGFTAAMMLKDLRLAELAAGQVGAATPLGGVAAALYALFCNGGRGGQDFSGIFRMIAPGDG